MSNLNYRVRVAVPVHLYDCFDYLLSESQYQQAQVGARVAVSFGRQNLVGIIIEKLAPDAPIAPHIKLKSITELLDDAAIFDANSLKLLTWASKYYQFPLGEVLHSALPSLLETTVASIYSSARTEALPVFPFSPLAVHE